MSMPGFTAEHALHDSGRRYRAAATSDDAPPRLRPAAAVECVHGYPWDVPEYHPNPESCNSFYQCAHGEPVLHDCPPGLVFDPNIRPGPVCVWPRDYHCKLPMPPDE